MTTLAVDHRNCLRDARSFIHQLHAQLGQDGFADVLAYLPPTTSVSFQQRPLPGSTEPTLSIAIDKSSILVVPDYQIRLDDSHGEIHQLNPEIRSVHLIGRSLGIPFSWALSSCGRECSRYDEWGAIVALVHYYCILHMIDRSLDVELPFPRHKHMAATMRHFHGSHEFQLERRKDPGRPFEIESSHRTEADPFTDVKGITELASELWASTPTSAENDVTVHQLWPYSVQIGYTDFAITLNRPKESKEHVGQEITSQPSDREPGPGLLGDMEIDKNDIYDGHNKSEAIPKSSNDEPESDSSDGVAIDKDDADEGRRYPARNCISRVSLNIDEPRLDWGDIDVSITEPPNFSNENAAGKDGVKPAGLGALEALRSQVPSLLLSRLPRLDQTVFKEKKSRLQCMPMCLLIGRYGDSNPARWGEEVWAYLLTKANPNERYAPIIVIQVNQRHRNEHDLEQVTWNPDIKEKLVSLEPVFQHVTSDAELKAVTKYCFLLVTEPKLFGHQRLCIPINKSFVKHLTKVCEQYGNVDSDIEIDHAGNVSRRLVAKHHRRASIVDQPMSDSDVVTNSPAQVFHTPSDGDRRQTSPESGEDYRFQLLERHQQGSQGGTDRFSFPSVIINLERNRAGQSKFPRPPHAPLEASVEVRDTESLKKQHRLLGTRIDKALSSISKRLEEVRKWRKEEKGLLKGIASLETGIEGENESFATEGTDKIDESEQGSPTWSRAPQCVVAWLAVSHRRLSADPHRDHIFIVQQRAKTSSSCTEPSFRYPN